ncbi:MAG: YqcC family protein [Pseudomonadota bacterium]
MDRRRALLVEQLLLIETELRLQGWWALSPPAPEALASPEPFCVDTLEFEQWLQWICVPRMAALLESAAPLPGSSGIQAMAEVVFRERMTQARPLVALLGEFDRLLQERP